MKKTHRNIEEKNKIKKEAKIIEKGMNRTSGKPLKTRASGISGAAGIPCLLLGLCQGSMGAAVTSCHCGHKSDPL